MNIRLIRKEDDPFIAAIIRNTLLEFGVAKPGTVYYDEATDHLSDIFKGSGGVYYVIEESNEILGGAGIFPTDGLPEETCELVKMYLLPQGRGKGYGKILIEKCIAFANENGYRHIYLESMPELKTAITIYEKMGFEHLDAPLGNTGHFGCDVRMLKKL